MADKQDGPERKVCPLTMASGYDKRPCLRDDCAWWVEYGTRGKAECAAVNIAMTLQEK